MALSWNSKIFIITVISFIIYSTSNLGNCYWGTGQICVSRNYLGKKLCPKYVYIEVVAQVFSDFLYPEYQPEQKFFTVLLYKGNFIFIIILGLFKYATKKGM
jgi:hypothetical protein